MLRVCRLWKIEKKPERKHTTLYNHRWSVAPTLYNAIILAIDMFAVAKYWGWRAKKKCWKALNAYFGKAHRKGDDDVNCGVYDIDCILIDIMRLSCVSDIKYIRPRNVRIIGGTVVVLAIWNQMSTNLCTSDGIQQEKAFTQYTQTHTQTHTLVFAMFNQASTAIDAADEKIYSDSLHSPYILDIYISICTVCRRYSHSRPVRCLHTWVRSIVFVQKARPRKIQ